MKFLLIILSLFSASLSFAQEPNKPFEKILGWKGSIIIKSITDSIKANSCVLVKNEHKLKAFLFDTDMQFNKEFETTLGTEKIVGGYIKDQEIQIYLEPELGANKLRHLAINAQTGKITDTVLLLSSKGEETIGRFNARSSFLHITLSKRKPTFNIYKFEGSLVRKISFDLSANGITCNFPQGDLWTALSPNSGISRPATIGLIDSNLEADVTVASLHNKMYLINNTVTLIIDQFAGRIGVLNLNLLNGQSDYRSIDRPFMSFPKQQFNNPDYNSFLLQDRLYSVHVTVDSLNLLIQDFKTGRVLKQFRALESEVINFRNTAIMQEGGNTIYSIKPEKDIAKTRQLIKRILNSNAVISASVNREGQHEITIGAYKLTQNAAVVGAAGVLGGAIGGALIAMTPGFGAYSWNKTVRFKSLIDSQTSLHIQGEMKESAAEQIHEYTINSKINGQASSVLFKGKFLQFAYYTKAERKMTVMKFE